MNELRHNVGLCTTADRRQTPGSGGASVVVHESNDVTIE